PGSKCAELASTRVSGNVRQIIQAVTEGRPKLFHRLRVSTIGYVQLDVGKHPAELQVVSALGPRQIISELQGILRSAKGITARARTFVFQSRKLKSTLGHRVRIRDDHQARCV